MVRRLIIAAVLACAPAAALAAEGDHPRPVEWSFEGPFGTFDEKAVQRGFQIYTEVCAACHTLDHLSYRNLGEKNGPFAAYGRFNPASGSWEDIKLAHPGHNEGHLVPAAENPFVRALAAQHEITEIDRTNGQEITRPARPSDRFVSPYKNPYEAKATYGVAPPDLSVITLAREDGHNYIHALLTGYRDPPPGESPPGGLTTLQYNPYYAGGWIAMPPPLPPERVTYTDGTQATPDQMARDVVTFLAWASDPKQTDRKQAGLVVLIYLAILAALLYAAYKAVWRNEKH